MSRLWAKPKPDNKIIISADAPVVPEESKISFLAAEAELIFATININSSMLTYWRMLIRVNKCEKISNNAGTIISARMEHNTVSIASDLRNSDLQLRNHL